jgi:putative hydrolase of the HAD superfamily
MQKIRAILFDLDNTLLDFLSMKEQACRAAVRAMIGSGLQMSEDEAYSSLMQTYFSVGIESDNAFTEFLKQTGQFDERILRAGIDAYLKTKNIFLKPYPNVKSVLKQLHGKGITLSIITDAPRTKARQRLQSMGIESYFNFVVAHEDTGSMKHTGRPLRLALQLLRKEMPDIANSEILMVGDSTMRDLEPAKKIGLKTALSRYGQRIDEPGTPDYELSNFKDLTNII